MRVALRRGRLEHQRASALITSANDSLVGNLQPDYWRFEGGINVDGALRAQAGPDLIDACLALPANMASTDAATLQAALSLPITRCSPRTAHGSRLTAHYLPLTTMTTCL